MTRARTSLSLLVAALSVASALPACGASRPRPVPPAAAPIVAAPARRVDAPAYGAAQIDAALDAAWSAAAVAPAPAADDATFLRRVTLDVAGTIPTADEAAAFLSDRAPDRRARLVDRLLASTDYARYWTAYWDDVLMGRDARGPFVDRAAFRRWLTARLAANTPWDAMARELVSATGQNTIDGAVNWTLRFEQRPEDLAGSASRVLLGVQIQCAECHDHKTETWKQDDFRRFAAAFLHLRPDNLDPGVKGPKRVDLVDNERVPQRFAKGDLAPIAKARATALDGTDLEKGAGTRKALAAWMTSRENPWFARAFVNRMWGHFLGRGFVDPVDDVRPGNPAAAPDVLSALAADFARSGFDVHRLVRTITATKAYGLGTAAASAGDPENKLWARFHLAPLGPEELLAAIFRATSIESAAKAAGVANLDGLRAQVERQYAFLFDTDEEDDVPDFSGTVSQALVLLNGQLVGHGVRAVPGSALDEILARPGTDGDRIDALVLRVLSRRPTDAERARWVTYVDVASRPVPRTIPPPRKAGPGGGPLGRLGSRSADPRRAAFEDVFWALLNSSEFTFNH